MSPKSRYVLLYALAVVIACVCGALLLSPTNNDTAEAEGVDANWTEADLNGPYNPSKPLPVIGQRCSAFIVAEKITTESDPESELVSSAATDSHSIRIGKGAAKVFMPGWIEGGLTKAGCVRWVCGDREGTVQFSSSSWTVLVIRDADGKVHWYRLDLEVFLC